MVAKSTAVAKTAAGKAAASARERLLAAADELFYEEGVHTVGIDRVIERAGVAKASLYNTFGSKDELIRCYLRERHEDKRDRIMRGLERYGSPREKLLGVYEIQAEAVADPKFRGCAFVNASAEAAPGGPAEDVSAEHRGWLRALFVDLAEAAGAADAEALAGRLVLLYDGATIGARMDRDAAAPLAARAVAEVLIDQALAAAPNRATAGRPRRSVVAGP